MEMHCMSITTDNEQGISTILAKHSGDTSRYLEETETSTLRQQANHWEHICEEYNSINTLGISESSHFLS